MASLWKIGTSLTKLTKLNINTIANCKNVLKFTRKNTTVALNTNVTTANNRKIGLWLAGCSGMVAGAVVLGGVTRLTESGLSMVDWKLIKDMVPPKNEQEWQEEFDKYKEFPEWKYMNKDKQMTLEQFKFIFYMEWGHRMWGRLTGLVFLLPAAYFWKKGYFNSGMKKRIGVFSVLLGFQGFLGWYMVKSGLNEPEKQTDVPRVSQYRLAAHLGSAFLLYVGFLWNSLNHLLPNQKVEPMNAKLLRGISMRSHGLLTLIFTTALAGAFVAGLDAGLVYNSFPKFADRWIPTDLWTIEPKWKNFFENPTMVQFQHRMLATGTLAAICLYAFSMRRVNISPRARLALNTLVGMSFVQVGLGIATLLYYVPTHLGALHQSGSLALLSFGIWLATELKRVPKI
ncbi:cytochrome c oxidase assembly COX15 -like protein [Brachionus plicatilis]|uniref:Cytochrome c oxidase assembly COX15-like protein n=1 Tax=Brachionus plicatilis TaxID=10195 RepID=A0A3M7R5K9_BRAPC|nr:cytochrome c oxidase assembly COX15 -like protein [Brachionus plicatilis]